MLCYRALQHAPAVAGFGSGAARPTSPSAPLVGRRPTLTTQKGLIMQKPVNLRVEQEPYPHLRDDEGCVLARDYQHDKKLAFILAAVAAFDPTPPQLQLQPTDRPRLQGAT